MRRCPLRNKASKKGISISVILSMVLHILVFSIAGFSYVIPLENEKPKPLIVNIASVAAPSVAEQKTSEKKKEKAEEKIQNSKKESEILPKPQSMTKPSEFAYIAPQAARPENNIKQQLTSNDVGNSVSTIIPTATEADYAYATPPVYPPRAIDLGQQGMVVVKALISKDGSAAKVTVYASSGYDLLDRSALNAVKEWSFKPSALQNNQIASWILVPVKFVIQG